MKRAWMPLYVGDYLGDTGHLTTTQHGAYLLLMMHYWRKGDLPDDDRQLSKITKLSLRAWNRQRETLQAFFFDGWCHKRIDAEIAKMTKTAVERSASGYKGGIQSALGRMREQNAAAGKSNLNSIRGVPPKSAWLNNGCDNSLINNDTGQANVKLSLSTAQAELDHSHSQSKTLKKDARQGITPSPELLAVLNRKAIG